MSKPTHITSVLTNLIIFSFSVLFFKDHLNALNMTGCFVVFLGVFLYKLVFHLEKEKKKMELERTQREAESDGLMIELDRSDHEASSDNGYSPRRSMELLDRAARRAGAKSDYNPMSQEPVPDDEDDNSHDA